MCKEELVKFFLDKCMLAFEQVHLLRKKNDTLQKLLVCTGLQGKLIKKIEKLRAHSGLVLVMTHCSGFSCRPLCNLIAGYSQNLSKKIC